MSFSPEFLNTLSGDFLKFYEQFKDRIQITGFQEEEDAKAILRAMDEAYGSEIFREMIHNWLENDAPPRFPARGPITINYRYGKGSGGVWEDDNGVSLGEGNGEVFFDLNYVRKVKYITDYGEAVEHTVTSYLVHELVHALGGLDDDNVMNNGDTGKNDYRGETVKKSNEIYEQLGIKKENSYINHDPSNFFEPNYSILTPGMQYTDGAEIDRSVAVWIEENGTWDHSTYMGNSRDLLIGSFINNTLKAGGGNDWLYGMEGDDKLYGGDGDDYLYGDDKYGEMEIYEGDRNIAADKRKSGAGNDQLYGGTGENHLYGGRDFDTYYIGQGHDIIEDSDNNGCIKLLVGENDQPLDEWKKIDLHGGYKLQLVPNVYLGLHSYFPSPSLT